MNPDQVRDTYTRSVMATPTDPLAVSGTNEPPAPSAAAPSPPLPSVGSLATRLQELAWTTACARFNAARRLGRFHSSSGYATALLSILATGASLILAAKVNASPTLAANASKLTAFLVVISMLVLAIQLLDQSQSPQLQAHALHDGAMKLNALYKKVEILRSQYADTMPFETLIALQAEYDAIVKDTRINHQPVDYDRFRLQHLKDKIPKPNRVGVFFRAAYPLIFHWTATVGMSAWLITLVA